MFLKIPILLCVSKTPAKKPIQNQDTSNISFAAVGVPAKSYIKENLLSQKMLAGTPTSAMNFSYQGFFLTHSAIVCT